MELVQWYETTVADRDGGNEASVIVIPTRSIQDSVVSMDLSKVCDKLGLVPQYDCESGEDVANILFMALVGHSPEALVFPDWKQRLGMLAYQHQGVANFSKALADTEVVPFEHSPVGPVSVRSLFHEGKGSLVTAGTALGLAATGPHHLLLLLAAPAGIVLIGSSLAVTEVLNQFLKARLRSLLGLPEEPPVSPLRRRHRSSESEPGSQARAVG